MENNAKRVSNDYFMNNDDVGKREMRNMPTARRQNTRRRGD